MREHTVAGPANGRSPAEGPVPQGSANGRAAVRVPHVPGVGIAGPPMAPLAGGASLAGASAPPLALPGSHFVVALLFLLLGTAGLVWAAPDLAAGMFPQRRVVAVTHLFTLGWITTSILGALCQLLPVVLGQPLRSTRAAYATLALHAPGLLLFVIGLVTVQRFALLAGAALFGTGLLLFVGNLALTLARIPRRDLTWWCLAGAAFFLTATVALGVTLAGNLHYGYLGGSRLLVLGVHVHIAIAGWVLLVVVGVARHLLPMFLLSHGVPLWPAKSAAALLGAGVMVLALGHHAGVLVGYMLPALLIAAGTAAFLVQAALFFRHRRRPRLDAGMRLAAAALAMLALALALAPLVLVRGFGAPRLATAYGAALVLGLALFVAGHFYKILPFLVWNHRYGPLIGKRPLPRVAELFSARTANVAAVLLALGAFGLIGAVLGGTAAWARADAALIVAGGGILTAQMIGVLRRRPE